MDDPVYTDRMSSITREMTNNTYQFAYRENSLFCEAENGVNNTNRIWWVQAETVVGLLNGYQKQQKEEYLDAAEKTWEYIKEYFIDQREGSEWFWCVDEN